AFQTPERFLPLGVRQTRLHFLRRWLFWQHLAVGLVAMSVLTWSYKQASGLLSSRESTYTYWSGYDLLSRWAPVLQPQDSPDSRLAEIIRHGGEFDLKNEAIRNAQRYAPGHLVERWRNAESDKRKAEEIAASTAINALRRDPGAVIQIAAKTYYAFWRGPAMERYAKI